VTPHLHHGEMSGDHDYIDHQEADDLIDWLILSFHLDLGDGHLECYSQSNHLDFSMDYQWVANVDFLFTTNFQHLLIELSPVESIMPFERRDKLLSPDYHKHSPLRAPPFCA
jgi:hypothetical protein